MTANTASNAAVFVDEFDACEFERAAKSPRVSQNNAMPICAARIVWLWTHRHPVQDLQQLNQGLRMLLTWEAGHE